MWPHSATILAILLVLPADALVLGRRGGAALSGSSDLQSEAARVDAQLSESIAALLSAAPAVRAAPATAATGRQQPANATQTSGDAGGNVTETLQGQQKALQDLLVHMKSRIAKFNEDEESGKAKHKEMAENLQQRLDHDREQLKDPKLSAFDRELIVNRTLSSQRELTYFNRGRDLQHNLFHANLKVTHSMMSRVKTVMDVYEAYLTHGQVSPDLVKKMQAVAGSLPVTLLQASRRQRAFASLAGRVKAEPRE